MASTFWDQPPRESRHLWLQLWHTNTHPHTRVRFRLPLCYTASLCLCQWLPNTLGSKPECSSWPLWEQLSRRASREATAKHWDCFGHWREKLEYAQKSATTDQCQTTHKGTAGWIRVKCPSKAHSQGKNAWFFDWIMLCSKPGNPNKSSWERLRRHCRELCKFSEQLKWWQGSQQHRLELQGPTTTPYHWDGGLQVRGEESKPRRL